MGGVFNIREPSNTRRIHQYPLIVDIFRNHYWLGFFELLKGYDDDLDHEFSMALHSQEQDSGTTLFRGFSISLNLETISKVTNFPLGIIWNKEDKKVSFATRKYLFLSKEKSVEDKNGVRRESIHYPWDEIAYPIIKYISCEWILSVVYAYHFKLLEELRFKEKLPLSQRLSVPHFLLH